MVQPPWKTVRSFLESEAYIYHLMYSSILGIYPKEKKAHVQTKTFVQMIIALYFWLLQTGKNPSNYQQVNG